MEHPSDRIGARVVQFRPIVVRVVRVLRALVAATWPLAVNTLPD
jgi:hypothetical protein